MKRALVALALSSLTLAGAGAASAAPKHPICADIGSSLGVGVSRFGSTGTWDEVASTQYGAKWRFLYWYHNVTNDPAAEAGWVQGNVQIAQSIDAIPVFTFYHILKISTQHGYSGAGEAQIEQQAEQDPAVMKAFFDDFVNMMKSVANAGTPVIVQVEPDMWGFMIFAMGIDGNPDATSVPVKVGGSGHPDVAGFPDHAGGLGNALLKLRDQYAPEVRLGWHVSNWRTGHKGDVVAKFYSAMGEWDVLFGEHPHIEGDPAQWWLPWDEAKVQQNLSFFSTVTSAAHLPILLWQAPVGSTDYHLLSSDPTMRTRFAQAGVVGDMMEVKGQGNPDDYRAGGTLGTVPPAGSDAGGTAKDMRARVAAYSKNPLAWPAGSLCAGVMDGGGTGSSSSGSSSSAGSGAGTGAGGAGTGAGGTVDPGGGAGGAGGGGSSGDNDSPGAPAGCSYGAATPVETGAPWLSVGVALGLISLRRRRRSG